MRKEREKGRKGSEEREGERGRLGWVYPQRAAWQRGGGGGQESNLSGAQGFLFQLDR